MRGSELTNPDEVEFGGVVARGDGISPYQGYQRVVLKLSGEACIGPAFARGHAASTDYVRLGSRLLPMLRDARFARSSA